MRHGSRAFPGMRQECPLMIAMPQALTVPGGEGRKNGHSNRTRCLLRQRTTGSPRRARGSRPAAAGTSQPGVVPPRVDVETGRERLTA